MSDPSIGGTVSHYRLLSRLGAGGMGVVYLAEDLLLKRKVALKFLGPLGDADASRRLVHEALIASRLDHPNVNTIYEVGEWEGRPFIAMAYCPGETLATRLARGPLSLQDVLTVGSQVASGLAAAHAAGVVHRDLKPANLVINPAGHVRILDFGLAKTVSLEHDTMTVITREGMAVGTLAYMSPEQAQGLEVDPRTDIWSLGAVLYEMLAGRPLFQERTPTALLLALTARGPVRLDGLPPDTPDECRRILAGMLERDPAYRAITAAAIQEALVACRVRLSAEALPGALSARWQRPRRVFAIAVLAVLLAGVAAAWLGASWLNRRWATREALPEIARLADAEEYAEALALAQKASRYVPGNTRLASLVNLVSRPARVTTTPPGARVAYAVYAANPSWHHLGTTPLQGAVVPQGLLRWRIELDGFTTFEDAVSRESEVDLQVRLVPTPASPDGMVPAPGSVTPVSTALSGRLLPSVTFPDFWIDRHEVTNRAYLAFVEAGGYRNPKYWTHPFQRNGVVIPWSEAIAQFTDQTGRPGPATWLLGRPRGGEGELPVTGVSWYEAAAYASYAGKDLPTVYHWNHVAAHEELRAQVVPLANFSGRSLLPVGRTAALHRFGAYDLAGNVKEWVVNESTPGLRYILGGAWNEPAHQFAQGDARSAWDRQANFGVRCVRYEGDRSFLARLSEPIAPPTRDYSREKPVGDELFRVYAGLYAYDPAPLDSRVESVDESPPDWSRQTVSFRAAYGRERMQAHLFLPRRTRPPYQVAVFVPGAGALDVTSSRPEVDAPYADFIVRSGRALVLPILRGTFERSTPDLRSDTPRESSAFRDLVIDWSRDLGRTIDYLETRRDVAIDKLAYVGVSRGGALAPVLLAVEPRVKVAVLLIPGFYAHKLAPEVDVINFAPRATVPVLVLNGRYDFLLPATTSQEPFFRALGTPAAHKRRVVYDTGHDLPRNAAIKESLAWLDKYLGPVE